MTNQWGCENANRVNPGGGQIISLIQPSRISLRMSCMTFVPYFDKKRRYALTKILQQRREKYLP